MKTEAAILSKRNQPLTVRTLDLAEPKFGEVRVKMVATSICHTDLNVINGNYSAPLPIILGHEGAAIVEAIGLGVYHLSVGDHVVITPLPHCNQCRYCLEGKPFFCEGIPDTSFDGTMPDGTSRFSLNGKAISHLFCQSSFAKDAVVMASACVKVPKTIPLKKLAPLACGVLTGAGAVLNNAKVRVGHQVAIFGCGGVGLSSIMAAKLAGALEIIAIDINRARLKLAKELGATTVLHAGSGNLVDKIRKVSNGGVDFAFECVGKQETVLECVECLCSGGSAIISGGLPDGAKVAFDGNELLAKNIRGNIAGHSVAQALIPQLIKYWQMGRFPFERLSGKIYPLQKINQAIKDMQSGKIIKPIIDMQ